MIEPLSTKAARLDPFKLAHYLGFPNSHHLCPM